MRYRKNIISGILIFVLGFIFGQISTSANPEMLPNSSPLKIKVNRVIDGDTIELANGQHVRYIGIDAPETVDPRKPVQCYGKEASAKNKELVEGKTVRLEKDITDKDKYGRLLRYVYVSSGSAELFVNLELVKQGYAHSYTYPPDVKYQEEILLAERQAREENKGLWKSCPAIASL
ncbi:MAG: thermonuclease family protein [Candidatus Gottesmanbacteria bacterium]